MSSQCNPQSERPVVRLYRHRDLKGGPVDE